MFYIWLIDMKTVIIMNPNIRNGFSIYITKIITFLDEVATLNTFHI